MTLDRLLVTLRAIGLEPIALEVAETLWLAQHIEPAPAAGTETHHAPRMRKGPQHAPPERAGREEAPRQPPSSSLHATGEQSTRSRTVNALPARVPAVKALPDTGRISRELRPLNRRSPSRRDIELDEQATAERSAEFRSRQPEARRWQLVRRPVQDRWLDLMVIVDVHPSMILWKAQVEELCTLLKQQGAFEDVRIWYLHHRPGGVGLSPVPTASRGLRAPAELIDPTGHRLTLFISDMVARVWETGDIIAVVEQCAQHGPTALLQPLPERLWPRTALNPRHGRIHSLQPGSSNKQFKFVPRTLEDELPKGTIPVPVLEMTAASLGAWARLVVAGNSDGVDATVLGIGAEPVRSPEGTVDPRELLARFRATASPQAFRLLRHLAAAPLSLPVMRLVQRATSAEPDPSHLAEVYLSGLLERTGAQNPDAVAFEFAPGVRNVLTGTLRRSEALRVLDTVSRAIPPRVGSGPEFTAYALAGEGRARATAVSIDSFAVIANDILKRMGVLEPGGVRAREPSRRVHDSGFEAFVRANADSLYQFLSRRLSSADEAEDAFQEVFVRAMTMRDRRPDGELPSTAWLIGVAQNVLKDLYRRRSRDVPLGDLMEVDDDHEAGPWEHLPPVPSSDYLLLESKQPLWATLTAALEGIPPAYRRIMSAHQRLTLERQRPVTGAELASELDAPVSVVSKQLRRGRVMALNAIEALVVARTSTCPTARELTHVPRSQSRAERDLVLDPVTSGKINSHARTCPTCEPVAREARDYASW
ncbi:sigma-70 family RNA polymerase sigma factor [Amycolatopsis sp. lyj-109]|uniref:sigma-70 family RNA polymerase sigma factor n=1 Tax=Amycolatopsis sp. lyj-109 TaxID=2789287 RepID=UPI00397C7931